MVTKMKLMTLKECQRVEQTVKKKIMSSKFKMMQKMNTKRRNQKKFNLLATSQVASKLKEAN